MVYVATLVGYIKYYSKKQKYNIKRVNKNKRKHDLLGKVSKKKKKKIRKNSNKPPPPPPPPGYGKFFFIFFSETRPFFENFL